VIEQITFMTLLHEDFFIFDNKLSEIPSPPISLSITKAE